MIYPGSCTSVDQAGSGRDLQGSVGKEYESPFTDQKVREAFAYAFDARGLGQGRGSGPVAADLDLDPARVPWVRCHEITAGVRSRAGQEGAGRVDATAAPRS